MGRQNEALKRQLDEERAAHCSEEKRLCGQHADERIALRADYQSWKADLESQCDDRVLRVQARAEAELKKMQQTFEEDMVNLESDLRAELKSVRAINVGMANQHTREKKRWAQAQRRLERQLAAAQQGEAEAVGQLEDKRVAALGRPVQGLRTRYDQLCRDLKRLQEELRLRSRKLPNPDLDNMEYARSDTRFNENLQFVAAALSGRNAHVISSALSKNDQINALFSCKEFQPFVKREVASALKVLQKHIGGHGTPSS